MPENHQLKMMEHHTVGQPDISYGVCIVIAYASRERRNTRPGSAVSLSQDNYVFCQISKTFMKINDYGA